MTIPTDTPSVTLTYGEHLDHDPAKHISFGRNPLDTAIWATVDSVNRRVVYFPTNPITAPRSGAGGKIKKAMETYKAKYGDSIFTTVAVRHGVVLSVQHVSQKATYFWDWHTHKQKIVKGGWKYPARS